MKVCGLWSSAQGTYRVWERRIKVVLWGGGADGSQKEMRAKQNECLLISHFPPRR